MSERYPNGLIFTLNYVKGCHFCDVGLELSKRLKFADLSSAALPFIVEDMLAEIVKEYTMIHENGWKYLALENFNILFEPALKVNINAFIKKAGTGVSLILKTDHPVQNYAYYPFPGDTTRRIDLNNIPLTQIGFQTSK